MSSPFDGAGKTFREPSWTAAIVLFVAIAAAVVAMWMAPAFLPENGGTETTASSTPDARQGP